MVETAAANVSREHKGGTVSIQLRAISIRSPAAVGGLERVDFGEIRGCRSTDDVSIPLGVYGNAVGIVSVAAAKVSRVDNGRSLGIQLDREGIREAGGKVVPASGCDE